MDGRLDWHPEKLLAKVRSELMANGELVGKFVSTDAKRRLLDLPDIETFVEGRPYVGGGGYRRYVAGLIGYDVTVDDKGLLVRVGVGEGRGGRHHGLYIELGSRVSPPRPFLRPAVFENADQIVQLLVGQ